MKPRPGSPPDGGDGTKTRQSPRSNPSPVPERPDLPLVRRLARLWPRLLELPAHPILPSSRNGVAGESGGEGEYGGYDISVIVPAYGESAAFLRSKLDTALERCDDPARVEIVVVDAGGGSVDGEGGDGDLRTMLEAIKTRAIEAAARRKPDDEAEDADACRRGDAIKAWGRVRYLPFRSGGGRGPCLNYGAAAANGRILTFCHVDTTMPAGWDAGIRSELDAGRNGDGDGGKALPRTGCCAFRFGIDTSVEGLRGSSVPTASATDDAVEDRYYHPPGIEAVEITANLRTRLYSLPYGDQTLSLSKTVFDFLGGFPDQCLMEDYELVALLRKRASMPPPPKTIRPNNDDHHHNVGERLGIVPGDPALCSPRRWQKFGVPYVTYTNSKLVGLYEGGGRGTKEGGGPDDLYRRYYGCDPPEREVEVSPWEKDLEALLAAAERRRGGDTDAASG